MKYVITIADKVTGKRSTHEIISDEPLNFVVSDLCGDTHREVTTVTYMDDDAC
jgi:hypothetical protein